MKDILLIHPAPGRAIYGELAEKFAAREQPLWCRLIAGYLVDKGWEVMICDQEAEGKDIEAVAVLVDEIRPRLVAICVYGHQPSASTHQMAGAHKIAEAIRGRNPELTTVMLGNHPSALPIQTLEQEPVDYVIDGEGPVTLDALLQRLDHEIFPGKALIPGLVYRVNGGIKCNPRGPLLDVDKDLHGQAWHLLPPPSSYLAHNWQCLDNPAARRPYAAIYTSLGCPYKCDFCMINTFQHTNKYRMRDPQAVVKEITWLHEKHGVSVFKIVDELFVLNRPHYMGVVDELINQKRLGNLGDINIWCYARTDTVQLHDLPRMREAGFKWLALGIESGNAGVRTESRKMLRNDADNLHIESVVESARRADINIVGNYIFGLPDDTYDTMEETLRLAMDLNTEWANFYCAMPYPGSPLYDRVARDRPGHLPPSWDAYSQHSRTSTPLRNANLSAGDILKFRDDAFVEYFTNADYHDLVLKKFGAAALDHIRDMLKITLERDLYATR